MRARSAVGVVVMLVVGGLGAGLSGQARAECARDSGATTGQACGARAPENGPAGPPAGAARAR